MEHQLITEELTAICNSLGKLDENDGVYMKDRDCKACLKEMLRYLNTDTKHDVRCILGSLNIIKSDLIPLMVQYCEFDEGDPELFTTILRLCTNLTSSVLLLFENKNDEHVDMILQNKLVSYLYKFKESFAMDDRIWTMLNTHLRHNTDDDITFERLIILIRNILHIPVDSTSDMGHHPDFDVHDMCLYRMDKSGMLDTIIKLAAETERGAEYCFHIMEIIYLMLRDQNPETIAKAKSSYHRRKLEEDDPDKKRLAELSEKNRREREASRNAASTRFARNSLYVVKNCKSLGNAPMIVHQPAKSRCQIKFDGGKTELRKARNKKQMSSETSMLISDTKSKATVTSYRLKLFCKYFVEKVYNNYMQQIKHNLIQKRTQENDESYYFWALQFFTSFSRHLALGVNLISESKTRATIHFIQVTITKYQDAIKMEKKEFQEMSRRLHLALRAYREVLILFESLEVDEDIKNYIFGETEYILLLLQLFQQYDEHKHSLHYLQDLVETNSVFFHLLEKYVTQQRLLEISCQFSSPDVAQAHVQVLKNYKSNRVSTNQATLKYLERVTFVCEREVLLFQASIFKCLLDIVDLKIQGYEDFKKLAKHLTERFANMANEKRWMFQEILFWKTHHDIVEIDQAINPMPVETEPPLDSLLNDQDNIERSPNNSPIDSFLDDLDELETRKDDIARPLTTEPPLDKFMHDLDNLETPKDNLSQPGATEPPLDTVDNLNNIETPNDNIVQPVVTELLPDTFLNDLDNLELPKDNLPQPTVTEQPSDNFFNDLNNLDNPHDERLDTSIDRNLENQPKVASQVDNFPDELDRLLSDIPDGTVTS